MPNPKDNSWKPDFQRGPCIYIYTCIYSYTYLKPFLVPFDFLSQSYIHNLVPLTAIKPRVYVDMDGKRFTYYLIQKTDTYVCMTVHWHANLFHSKTKGFRNETTKAFLFYLDSDYSKKLSSQKEDL